MENWNYRPTDYLSCGPDRHLLSSCYHSKTHAIPYNRRLHSATTTGCFSATCIQRAAGRLSQTRWPARTPLKTPTPFSTTASSGRGATPPRTASPRSQQRPGAGARQRTPPARPAPRPPPAGIACAPWLLPGTGWPWQLVDIQFYESTYGPDSYTSKFARFVAMVDESERDKKRCVRSKHRGPVREGLGSHIPHPPFLAFADAAFREMQRLRRANPRPSDGGKNAEALSDWIAQSEVANGWQLSAMGYVEVERHLPLVYAKYPDPWDPATRDRSAPAEPRTQRVGLPVHSQGPREPNSEFRRQAYEDAWLPRSSDGHPEPRAREREQPLRAHEPGHAGADDSDAHNGVATRSCNTRQRYT